MDTLLPADWAEVLLPQSPPVELIARMSIVYLALVLMFRFLAKREAGGFSLTDLLVLVLIADAVQNGMAGTYTSVGDSLILAVTLLVWPVAALVQRNLYGDLTGRLVIREAPGEAERQADLERRGRRRH